jgi:hydroxylaminobenzene mutase
MNSISSILSFCGVLLFMLGLLTGFAIPALRSPRLGLSAHLVGVQGGTFLIAMGLLWPHLTLWPAWNGAIGHGIWLSLYALWFSILLAGIFGAGRGLPIAGQGITTTPFKQTLVTAILAGSSLAVTVLLAAVLFGWTWVT